MAYVKACLVVRHGASAAIFYLAWPLRLAVVCLAFLQGAAGNAAAETLTEMLARVYQNNPQLNAARAQLRATDETVPQALSGYRPTLSVGALAGYNPIKNT